jgi:hypothetical protein
VLLVAIWAPSYFLAGNFDTCQLLISTPTTITSLPFALLQYTPRRSEQGVHKKNDAIVDGLSDLTGHFAGDEPEGVAEEDLSGDIEGLRAAAVGLEAVV